MTERYLISQCCQAAIDLCEVDEDGTMRCPACSKPYEVRDDIDFAEYSTGTMVHYKWAADGRYIVRYYFHNLTLDQLEGIAEQIKLLALSERRPHLLLPLFKAMHDCLKKRLQQYLVFDQVPNLSAGQKALIEADLPIPGNNLLKLVDYLSKAYPQQVAKVQRFQGDNKLQLLLWIRNKEEHLAHALWPMRSYVHTDKAKLPTDSTGHVAELTVPLAVDCLNFCIDFLRLIYDLDPKDIGQWQYEALERYRIHASV